LHPDEPNVRDPRCEWCGVAVERDDGYRLEERPGERRAAFCRLEHVIPWAIQGPHWQPGEIEEPPGVEEGIESCSQCGRSLPDAHLVLVRHRGEHRIPDGFCSADHLRAWASAGGRFGGA
jgi:hypothetical protein